MREKCESERERQKRNANNRGTEERTQLSNACTR